MRINFYTPISFESLQMRRINNLNFPEDFKCKSRNNNTYNVSFHEGYDAYQVYISNNKYREEPNAEQDISLYKDQDYMYVDNMFTDEENRSEGLGTCLHLINIIEMLENNLAQIELQASSSAIPFHIRLGFKPCDKWHYLALTKNIRAIAEDDSEKQFSSDAKLLLKSNIAPELKSVLANKLIYNYTLKAIKTKSRQEQENMFPASVMMVLTHDSVIKNKKFYNKLFKKYNIDYKI